MPDAEDKQTGKIESLESLRGLAALTVVISHLLLTFAPSWKTVVGPPGTNLWHHADFAVRTFFVLSGFVLSLSFHRTRDIQTLRRASARRYFRLAIPVAASVFGAYGLLVSGLMANHPLADALPFGPSAWLHSFYYTPPSITAAVRESLYGAYLSFQYTTSMNVVLWTMEVEFKGSLLVFATLALFGQARQRWLVYTLLAFTLDRLQHPHYLDFVVGMAICDVHCHLSSSRLERWLGTPLLVSALLLADLRADWLESVGMGYLIRGTRLWPTMAAGLLVFVAARDRWVQRFLNFRPFLFLGKISFSLYLFHLPVICSLGAFAYLWGKNIGLTHGWSASIASLACFVASLLISYLGAKWLDPAGIKLGRMAARWLFC